MNLGIGLVVDTPAVRGDARHVILLAGQSNMVGRADFDGGAEFPEGTLQWGRGGPQNNTLIPATPKLQHHDPYADSMGLALQFAIDFAATRPSDSIVLVPCAKGGTGFRDGQWNVGDPLYVDAVARAGAALAACPGATFTILWHQGEKDAGGSSTERAAYLAALDATLSGFRSDIVGASAATPIVLGGLAPDFLAAGPTHAEVQAVIDDTPNRLAYVAVASSAGLTDKGDDLHFDAAALRTLGARYVTALAAARTNVPTAPGAVSGLSLTPGSGTLGASWTAPSVHGAPVTDYVVEVRPAGGAWATFADGVGTETSAVISDLSANLHEVRVRALSAAGPGDWSAIASGTPQAPTTAPGAVTAVALTPAATQIAATWSAPASDGGSALTDYVVELRPAGGAWAIFADGTSTQASTTITGLTPATQYEVRVSAKNAIATGPASAVASTTTLAAPSGRAVTAFAAASTDEDLSTYTFPGLAVDSGVGDRRLHLPPERPGDGGDGRRRQRVADRRAEARQSGELLVAVDRDRRDRQLGHGDGGALGRDGARRGRRVVGLGQSDARGLHLRRRQPSAGGNRGDGDHRGRRRRPRAGAPVQQHDDGRPEADVGVDRCDQAPRRDRVRFAGLAWGGRLPRERHRPGAGNHRDLQPLADAGRDDAGRRRTAALNFADGACVRAPSKAMGAAAAAADAIYLRLHSGNARFRVVRRCCQSRDASMLADDNKNLGARAARGGLLGVAAQLVSAVLQLANVALMSRLLAPEDFGLFAMAFSIILFVGMFRELGLSMATVQRETLDQDTVSGIFYINLTVGAVLFFAAAAAAPFASAIYGDARVAPLVVAVALTIPLGAAAAQHDALLTRQMRFGALRLAQLSSQFAGMLAGVGLALAGFGIWALVANAIVAAVVFAALVWTVSGWRPCRVRDWSGTLASLSFGAGVTGAALVQFFERQFDNALIGWRWGAAELGFYSRAYGLLMLPQSVVMGPLTAAIVPALSRLQARPDAWRTLLVDGLRITSIVTFGAAAVVIANAEDLVRLVLGAEWSQSAPILALLGWSMIARAFNAANVWAFLSLGRTRRMFLLHLFTLPLYLGAYTIGSGFGGEGVALAFSIAYTAAAGPSIVVAFRGTPASPFEVVRAGFPLATAAIAVIAAAPAWRYVAVETPPALVAAINICATGVVYLAAASFVLWLDPKCHLRYNSRMVLRAIRGSRARFGGTPDDTTAGTAGDAATGARAATAGPAPRPA